MFTVRWVTGEMDRTHTRDEPFATKRAALEAIDGKRITSIRRLNKIYVVQLAK